MKSLRSFATIPVKLLLDLVITAGCLLGVYGLATYLDFPKRLSLGPQPVEGYLGAIAVIAIAFLWSAQTFRFYRARRAGSYLNLAADVTKVHLQLTLIVLSVAFYYRDLTYSRQIVTTFLALNPFLVFVHHVAWLRWERHTAATGKGARSCLIIGLGQLAKSLASRVNEHPWTGLEICGFLDAGENITAVVPHPQILGTIDDLERLVEKHRVQEVVLAVPFRRMGLLAEIDERLSKTSVGLRSILDLEAFNTISREIDDFDGLQVINLRGVRTYGMNAFVKRVLDITVSLALLTVLSPLLFALAVAILITSGRPIIFRQERVGLDGMVFHILKFRTMTADAEPQGPVWGDRVDHRCTTLGGFLRRASLDESPQLWNVLLGQMSLVGPRPERPIFIEEFRKTIPAYMLRHHMKAGLTGWAQVNGWRGRTSLRKRLQYDLYYMRNWSVWLDLKILFLTLVRAWRDEPSTPRPSEARPSETCPSEARPSEAEPAAPPKARDQVPSTS